MISEKLRQVIRDIPDFPKPGIIFKDITPILKDAELCSEVVNAFTEQIRPGDVDVIAGVESRGFLFGLMLANRLQVPFVPIRKQGKLPSRTVHETYELEYGSAIIELHADAILPGQRVLIHDDLLATGGTVEAACRLVQKLGGEVAGFSFVISLDFLDGRKKLQAVSGNIHTLVSYS